MRVIGERTYRIREFAELSGVTVRALHHYDRLGLLKPKRTRAGYRAYSIRDLETLEQIVALKFIGVPLKKIPILRRAGGGALAAALRAQRATLEEKKQLLDQAIHALSEVEAQLVAGKEGDASLFRKIIEVIEMQNNTDQWRKKYDSLVQAKMDRLRALSPEDRSELKKAWGELVADVESALDQDPAGAKAQALASRWVTLLERLMGGAVPESMLGNAAAYQDAPGAPSFVDRRVWDFMSKALATRRAR
jgi:MerR family transcriptional regulator, thiopeptide resistance regulator